MVLQLVRDLDGFNCISKGLLGEINDGLELLVLLLCLLLLVLALDSEVVGSDVAELLLVVVPKGVGNEGINLVGEYQDVVSLLGHGFDLRQVLGVGRRFRGHVVDLLLVLGHGRNVLCQRDHLVFLDRAELEEVLQHIRLCAVLVYDTVFDLLAEALPELSVLLGLILHDALEVRLDLLGQVAADHLELTVVLQDLTGDVEAEIRGIHYSADEAEAIGQEVCALVHDEDSVAVELESGLEVPGVEIVGGFGGDEQHRLVGDVTLNVDSDHGDRVLVVMELVLVELDAFRIVDLRLRFLPDRDHAVDDLVDVGGNVSLLGLTLLVLLSGLLPLAFLHDHVDRPADVIGILLDELPEPVGLQEFTVFLAVGILFDVHDDIGSDGILLTGGDRVSVDSVALPYAALLGSGGFGDDGHLVGDHKCGIESDSELSDGLTIGSFVEGFLELQGTAVCDVTEILLHLLGSHSDSVVGYGDSACILVDGDVDLQIVPVHAEGLVAERLVVQFVDSIGSVGNELPEENLLVGVDGVDHHIQDAFGFCLELFLCHFTTSL